jgi:hypothetical protein
MLQARSFMWTFLVVALVGLLLMCARPRKVWSARLRRATRRRRREVRELRLEGHCCRHERHETLSTLVDRLDEIAPEVVEAHQLDWLLERHAQLLIDRRRLVDALSLPPRKVREGAAPLRVRVHEAECAWRAACAHSIFQISDQLAAVEELVRLYCERSVLPAEDAIDAPVDPVERTIDLLDARDEAARVSA